MTEMFSVGGGLPDTEASQDKLYRWLTANYETIAGKLPPDFRSFLVGIGGGCSMERLEHAREFFTHADRKVDGTEAQLEKIADQVTDCVALRQREGQAVAAYLQSLRETSS